MATDFLSNSNFTFTWKIENFSFCFHQQKELISPIFSSELDHGLKWNLRLNPCGSDYPDCLTCYLQENGSGSPSTVNNIRILASNGTFVNLQKMDIWGHIKFVKRCELATNMELYVPGDILTIQCKWHSINSVAFGNTDASYAQNIIRNVFRIEKSVSGFTEKDFSDLETGLNSTKSYRGRVECIARSNIGVQELIFDYVGLISSLNWIPFVIAEHKSPALLVKMKLESTEKILIRVQKLNESNSTAYYSTCKLSITDCAGKELETEDFEHIFEAESREAWCFNMFCKHEVDEQRLKYNFKFKIATGTDNSSIERWVLTSQDDPVCENVPQNFRKALLSMYLDQKVCDLTLKAADGKTLRAHKTILAAQSAVFLAMFDHDTKENIENYVEIKDVDSITLDLMLKYIYSSELHSWSSSDAYNLYLAADKYQLLDLKYHCRSLMKEKLTVYSICSVLRLADMCNDSDLRFSAQNYFCANAAAVIGSDEWKDMTKDNTRLVLDVFESMVTKGVTK